MILSLFNSSWQDNPNSSKIMFLALILTELMYYKHLIIIDIKVWFSNCIQINLLLFDSSWWNDSNSSKIIFLLLILTEIRCYKCLKFFKYYLAKYFYNTKLITKSKINYI
jgi:hypothetical protein